MSIDGVDEYRFNVLAFDCLQPSIVMFIANYEGRVDLERMFQELPVESWSEGRGKELPVGPDGSIISKGFGDQRVGAFRIGRSSRVFRNIVGVDISADGCNVNFKIGSKSNIQAAGAKSVEHGAKATMLLFERLNKLPCLIQNPLRLIDIRIERYNYNFKLGFNVNLAKLALAMQKHSPFIVHYDNSLADPVRLVKISDYSEEIASGRSKLSKRSKLPSITMLIRKTGKIMIGGAINEEVQWMYETFHQLLADLDLLKGITVSPSR